MNVYDKAYELTKALQETEEAQELKAALTAARNDPEAKRMMEDFRDKQTVLQQKMMEGEQPSQEEMEMMNKLYEVVTLNPLLNRTFDAERRFSIIFDDVTKIVTESLKTIME
ncbi:UPF0342 protein [Paenibacillus baekrokdamisoli]|uniref:UPF0342 protein Back11_28370 n=1 Tax=Paenibacillus baekrokdamisoli TaxID=1712516 RepID=A0A3G9ITA5_9BACL|nr:YlbF family regulator [Paenibacillus baekrokdamisoli]MBB3071075.1 cell fate (sporulation/competence/biofilm development) regulator YlbF (YheA/YmcA/DUF963 family) [Paenibacillus baekrokdamisoli]BBH21492.1 UPF0342 protein [Paenibacillus baekrokdamisoli]